MPSFWQQMPFVRILIAFLMGILLADKAQANYQHACILATLPLFIIFYNKKISNKLNTPIPTGLAYFILFICLGIFCLNQQKTSFWVKHFSQEKYQAILVQTEQKPQLTKNGWKAEAFVIAGYTKHFKPQKCKGKIVIYSKNSPSFPKGYGHQFLIKSGIQEIVFNKNPGSFNFQEYMNRKGIFHQCYLNENTAQFIAKNQGNRILTQIFSFQDFIHQSLQENLLGKNEIAIAEALLYGYDKEIDDTVSDAFSKTGTLHVLAVSGMHVGLIFMLLSWLLTPLLKLKRGKLYVAIFQTIGIWLYAVLCGLSPSILRACVMFSFVIFGKQLNRSSNPFNSLSAAGFLLLAMQPLMLYNVGFQLSFAAVGGILGFYPYLNLWIQFKHTLLNEIWKIIAISLAAQTLTIPISIYYFHQFPNYFLLANLIIIPLSTLIIYGGILFLVCTPIKIVASAIGYVISKLITLTTAITIQIANLPYSSIENIIWSIPFIFSYYLIGILIIHYFSTRNISSLKAILLLLLLLSLFGLNQTFTQNKTQKLYILASKQNLVILAHQKHVLQIWHRANDSLETKKNWVQPYTMKYPIKKEIWQHIDSINYQLKIGKDKTLYILQQSALPAHLHPTLLLITGKNRQALAPILKHNTIQKVILHSDVPLYRKNIYKEILNKNKIPYHDITENGAFEVSL